MWNLEKDPHLSASIANVTILDRPPDLDRLRARLDAGRRHGAPAPPAGRARPSVGSPRRSGATTPTSTSTTTCAASRSRRPGPMRQLLDLAATLVADAVRPHPSALGVRRGRRPRGRRGRPWSRSCTTPSPTARAASGCRSSSSTSSATPPSPSPPTARRPSAIATNLAGDHRRHADPPAAPRASAWPAAPWTGSARRSLRDPRRVAGCAEDAGGAGPVRAAPGRCHRPGPLAAVDGALAAAAARHRCRCRSTTPSGRPRRWAAASTTSS